MPEATAKPTNAAPVSMDQAVALVHKLCDVMDTNGMRVYGRRQSPVKATRKAVCDVLHALTGEKPTDEHFQRVGENLAAVLGY